MLDATTRSGGTATDPPRASSAPLTTVVPATAPPVGLTARCAVVLRSPWARLSLLVVLLLSAASVMLLLEPQKLLTDSLPPQVGGAAPVVAYAVSYGVCTVAFVPRPLLNLTAGVLFGSQLGLGAALGGTVLGAALAFCLGRSLGRDALRPLLRGRWLKAADNQLSRHGFRSILAARLFPGVPFAASNYCAAVSRMGPLPFLLATGLGSVPNTAAYVVAGARASTPTSPAFLIALICIAVPGLLGTAMAWRKRHRLRARARWDDSGRRCGPPPGP